MKKILLVSPFPPAQNPRLYKEYLCLKNNGYSVKVIYAARDKWANDTILNKDFILVAGKIGSFTHIFSRVLNKLSKLLLPYEFTYHRASFLLLQKALRTKADLYIGHDLTSLPIVIRAAKKNRAKCGFDAEDFHRNESSDDTNSFFYNAAKTVEDEYLSKVDYLTCASPLITAAYQKLYPQLNPITINNVFSKSHIAENEEPRTNSQKLKLFWFSQTVGEGRGLEAVIEAMGILKKLPIELTILGEASEEIKKTFYALASANGLSSKQFLYIDPVTPDQIFPIAATHHIGLALEISIPYNRDICLTNKIFTYFSSGLAVIASETTAQKKLIQESENVGLLFKAGAIQQLADHIKTYYDNPPLLELHRATAKKLAKEKFNWEKESEKFLQQVSLTLKNG